MQERRSNFERRQETRSALIEAARALFIEKSYAETSTPEMVERAGLTRGALYHHFRDKQALFLAVVEAEAVQVAAEIEAKSASATAPFAALQEGAQAYFEAMRSPGRVRLLLLDGPAVLGAQTMRRIDLETGGQELRRGLAGALGDAPSIARIEALADLVSAMFDRAVMACDVGADPRVYQDTIDQLLAILVDRGEAFCDNPARAPATPPEGA